MSSRIGAAIGIALATTIAAGCAGEEETAPPAPAEAISAPTRTEPEPPPPPDDTPARFAKVLESMDSGGYTFARLDACGSEAWVAGPLTPLTVGEIVSMPMGSVMTNFSSPTLGRTFDMILFVGWFRTVPESEAPPCPVPGEASAPSDGARPPRGAARTGPPGEDEWAGKVSETVDSGGYTYARLNSCKGESMWVAAPVSKIAVGQSVAASGGVPMTDFKSPSLDRTFKAILFAQSLRILDTPLCE